MKFSFIIPALNEEDYIADCIKSIKNQEESIFEIIVVDNGSTDKTVDIAKDLGCSLIKEKKKGISHARNKGAKVAKGDYLCFIDADGVLDKNWIKQARLTIEKQAPEVIDGLVIYKNSNLLKKIWYNSYIPMAYLGLIVSSCVFSRHFVTANNTVVKKSLFKSIGGFDPYVTEQVGFSRKLWNMNAKTLVDLKMIVYYSSRGFEKEGFLNTLFYWIKSAFVKASQEGYSYKSEK